MGLRVRCLRDPPHMLSGIRCITGGLRTEIRDRRRPGGETALASLSSLRRGGTLLTIPSGVPDGLPGAAREAGVRAIGLLVEPDGRALEQIVALVATGDVGETGRGFRRGRRGRVAGDPGEGQAVDILVIGMPIWFGVRSSVAQMVIERLDGAYAEPNAVGQHPLYNKPARDVPPRCSLPDVIVRRSVTEVATVTR